MVKSNSPRPLWNGRWSRNLDPNYKRVGDYIKKAKGSGIRGWGDVTAVRHRCLVVGAWTPADPKKADIYGQPVVAATVMEQTQPAARHDSMEATSTFTSGPQTLSPEKKRPLYPVREPYPVELLPPIVFFNMAEITPNTLIVYGFPKP